MYTFCSDLEGVWVPEVWVNVAKKTGIEELKLTTRDITDYDVLMKNMISSYQQRQVGLVEFIDFFDAYKDTRIKQWQLVTNQRNAAAELNYTINQNILKL